MFPDAWKRNSPPGIEAYQHNKGDEGEREREKKRQPAFENLPKGTNKPSSSNYTQSLLIKAMTCFPAFKLSLFFLHYYTILKSPTLLSVNWSQERRMEIGRVELGFTRGFRINDKS